MTSYARWMVMPTAARNFEGMRAHGEFQQRIERRTIDMTTNINNVTVLGTGVLGSQVAYQTAYSGFEVTAYDISDEIVRAARKRFAGLAARYEREVEGASDGRARAALDR